MKKSMTLTGAILIASFIFLSCDNTKSEVQNNSGDSTSHENKMNSEKALIAANDSLYAALNAMFTGNLEPMISVWSHADYVTQMSPFGGRLTGWEAVRADFKKVADMKLGGKISCMDMHVHAGNDMGYTICIEVGENMDPEGKPVKVSHRATNIFHLENGQWKLVHHHTDISTQLEDAYEGLKNE